MVFYRKYRPQTIDELDSTLVREKLSAVLKNTASVPHAMLFTGPKGLGKTSAARIIAKVVNCEADKKKRGTSGIEPCNACEQCRSITNGSNMDVLEIDAASNRGIDEIRELKETIKLSPLSSKKKVYIIDEVHMLTTEAFNALLKTLEEPPPHAMFLLCTTEPQKIPPTILSRAFHIAFVKASREELIRSFRRIVTAEKISITDEALELLAQLSEGGFRDGTKILEEATSAADGKEITVNFIEENYQIAGITKYIERIIELLVSRDTKELLTLIVLMEREGTDLRYILDQVIAKLHTSLLQKAGVTGVGEESEADIGLDMFELRELLLLLTQALSDMKSSVLVQLPFELAVIEWGVRHAAGHLAELGEKSAENNGEAEEVVSLAGLRRRTGNLQKIKALYGEVKVEAKKKDTTPTANVSVLDFSAEGEITPEWLSAFWTSIIHDVKQHNHTLAGVMRGCMIKSFDRKKLVIETAYAFHRDKLDTAGTKDIIEQICRNLTGNPVSVTVELKNT